MGKENDLFEPLEVRAIKPGGIRRWLQALGNTGFGLPLPRRGRHVGNGEVEIPHFFKGATRETVDRVESGIGAGEIVIVYNKGRSPD